MQTTVEPLADNRIRLRVEVGVHDIDHAFEHAIRDLGKDARIPGFRKGKVPAAVLKTRLGNEAIVEEALRGHLSTWFGRAMELERLEPVSRPDVDYDSDPVAGQPWTFTAEVTVPPTATFPKKLALSAVRPSAEVSSDAIDARLERMRGLAAQIVPSDATAAATGMFALIDFSSTVDGRKVKQGSATDYQFEIGSGRLLDGMEEAIIGMAPGETRTVDVELPADGPDKRFNGKTAVFSVTLKELKTRLAPELDDAFAKEISEFETIAELRADVERQLQERATAQADGEYRAAVLTALGAAATVDVPELMVARRLDDRLDGAARGMAQRGMRFDEYLRMTGQTVSDVAQQLRPDAEASAREELALKAYADRERIVVDDASLEAFVHEQAEAEQDPEEMARRVLASPAARESVREEMRLKRALDHAVAVCKPLPVARSTKDTLDEGGPAADDGVGDGSDG